MTKEELKKKAEEYYEDETEGTFQICEDCYWFADAVQTAYVDSAEPREKQIEIDAKQIRALQKQNGELTDKVNNLEEKLANADYQLEGRDNEIKELEAQIEKMKCCNNCKYRYFMDWKSVCGFDLSEIKDIENPVACKCNKWEIKEK